MIAGADAGQQRRERQQAREEHTALGMNCWPPPFVGRTKGTVDLSVEYYNNLTVTPSPCAYPRGNHPRTFII